MRRDPARDVEAAVGFRVEAVYRRDHIEAPAILESPTDVDTLIDTLLAGSVGENLAQLYCLERPLLPSGYPDHEFMVGVDRYLDVGVLSFMDGGGNWVPDGSPKGRVHVSYCEIGHRREFPGHSEIPIDTVRRAVKQFLLTGGQRPSCVRWKPQFPEILAETGTGHDAGSAASAT